MKTLPLQITVDIWSDFVCPWCWIAKKRFEQGLAAFEHKNKVLVQHHSYRIASGYPPMPFKAALVKKFDSKYSAELMMSQVKSAGDSEGLVYNFETMLFGDTKDAHAMVKIAHQTGLGEALTERLFKVSVTEGRSIFDRDELVALAIAEGVRPEDAINALNIETFKDAVIEDEAKARIIGVSGVPFFVLNGKYSISGAQPAANFLNLLRQVWAEKQGELTIDQEGTEGKSCGISGCSI